MDNTHMASVELALLWQSRYARHIEQSFFNRVNLSRDIFPGNFAAQWVDANPGETARRSVSIGEVIDPYDPTLVCMFPRDHFQPPNPGLAGLIPRRGRFYPRHFLRNVPASYSAERRLFRCLEADANSLVSDFNHPFAGYRASLEGRIVQRWENKAELGGKPHDLIVEMTADGPGMQAALPGRETDFFAGDPFARLDPRPDAEFYQSPRLVQHLDDVALAGTRLIYGEHVRPGMRVLDLMSSWVSHLPEYPENPEVTGLGLNREELERNPALSECVVHDLNANPLLPFEEATFDAALCTVSVEYLTRPIEVFRDVARVLRPGGPFVVTFSDRWFPPKVIALWTELHPFERMALVIEYFHLAGGFTDLVSISRRGWPRPADDKYAAQRATSDPLFAVSGVRQSDAPG